MVRRPGGSRNHSYSAFEFVRREFGQTVLECNGKFEKIGLKISKSYSDLQFNHRCKRFVELALARKLIIMTL